MTKFRFPLLFLGLLLWSGAAFSGEVAVSDGHGGWKHCNPAEFVLKKAAAQTSFKAGNIQTTVTYADVNNGSGQGFDDPSLGASRRATLTAVLTYIGEALDSSGGLDVYVAPSETDRSGAIASAGPIFGVRSGFVDVFAFTHIMTGVDPNVDYPDLQVNVVDFGYDLHAGLSDPLSNEYDLFSVLLHEITHGLGFLSFANADGSGYAVGDGTMAYSRYDSFIYTGTGTQLWTSSGFQGTAAMLAGTSNGLVFRGDNAMAEFGGAIPLYAPNPFAQASSVSHWDLTVETSAMRPVITPGVTIRTYTAYELGTLSDLGYSLSTDLRLVYPWVSNSNDFESTIVVNNPGATSATLQFTARRANGDSETSESITLGPGAFIQRKASELFPDLGVGSGYTVVLTSTSLVTGRWITFDKGANSPSQGTAAPITVGSSDAQGTALMFGYLPGNPSFQSAPVLVNVSDTPIDVTVYFIGQDGQRLRTLTFNNIQPLVPQVLAVITFSEQDQYAVATSSGGHMQGALFVFNTELQTAIGNATSLSSYTPPD